MASSLTALNSTSYRVNATILYAPDPDFQSLDGLSVEPDAWLEIPLKSDRVVPFKCAVSGHGLSACMCYVR